LGKSCIGVLQAEGTPTPGNWLSNTITSNWTNPKNAVLRAAYNQLVAAGDTHLEYVSMDELFTYKPVMFTPVLAK
jgi:hypothetical protein